MTWRRAYCSAKTKKGEPCGNPAPDGRGGFCAVHRRMRAKERGKSA